MNELVENENESEDDHDDLDDDFTFTMPSTSSKVPKSKSTPNLRTKRGMNISDFIRKKQPDVIGFHDRLTVLRDETQLMLEQAKKAAKLQMEVEKQREELKEKYITKRLTRLQLSRMDQDGLRRVLDQIKNKIDREFY